jgi:6-pyruvoyltetrahydropterin/6-carboxytetrahydropterin synthase
MQTATRYHDISAGHRVPGHEGKCRHLHGHNYRVTFTCSGGLDSLGRVIDFGELKSRLCMWLEEKWDHKMLLFVNDPMLAIISEMDPDGVVTVPFIPTAENMAQYLLEFIGPDQLAGTGITLDRVRVEETRKCAAEAFYGPGEATPAPKLAPVAV